MSTDDKYAQTEVEATGMAQESCPFDPEQTTVPTLLGLEPGQTCCDGDRRNNVWIEGGNPETGEGGVCMLDQLPLASIKDILSRDEVARRDLRKVTTNPFLLELADTVPRLPTDTEGDRMQTALNQGTASAFYTVFRGNPPYAT